MQYTFQVTVEWDDGKPVGELLEKLSQYGIATLKKVEGTSASRLAVKQRNAEIVRLYTLDPRKYSATALGKTFGITRERVCQILRRVNAIGLAQERRALAKELLEAEKATARAAIANEWEERLAVAVELVRKGMACRQASMAVGMQAHSTFTNALRKKAQLLGLGLSHSRWRDFSERIAKMQGLLDRGHSVNSAVNVLRAEGDRTIHYAWARRHFPSYLRPRVAPGSALAVGIDLPDLSRYKGAAEGDEPAE